ncbi:MAG: hypothetical protein ACQEXJ_07025 [Myxococcota bacterium]
MASGEKKAGKKAEQAEGGEETLPRVQSARLADEPVQTRLRPIMRFPPEDEGEDEPTPKPNIALVLRPIHHHAAPELPPRPEKPNTHYVVRQWSPRPKRQRAPSIGSMDPSRRAKK